MPPRTRRGKPHLDLLSPNHGDQTLLPQRLSEISDARSDQSSPSRANDFSSPGYSSAMSDVSTDTARKRKRSASPAEGRNKQAKLETSQPHNVNVRGYMAELNKDVWDISEGIMFEPPADSAAPQGSNLTRSQIGGTIWSQDDKERFFNALTIYGKDDIVSIASAVGNGIGAIQVKEYMTVLEDASIEYRKKIGPRRWNRMKLESQPAAYDIGNELLKTLNDAAAKLEARCLRQEEKAEMKKWGKYWLLNHNVSEQVKQQYAIDDEEYKDLKSRAEISDEVAKNGPASDMLAQYHDEPELDIKVEAGDDEPATEPLIYQSVPSAQLLHLPNFLRLSRDVFMNFPQEKIRPWQNGGPAIRQTAFSDLHNLVVSITRRVVSMVLFQTEIRIRNLRHQFRNEQKIREREVRTVLDILGMPKNSNKYWIGIPRKYRLQLTIAAKRLTRFELQLHGKQWTIDDVEALLKQPRRRASVRAADENSDPAILEPDEEDADDDDATEDDDVSEVGEDEVLMQTMNVEEAQEPGLFDGSDEEEQDAEDLKPYVDGSVSLTNDDDDSSDEYVPDSAYTPAQYERLDEPQFDADDADVKIDHDLIDPQLQNWDNTDDAMELGESSVASERRTQEGRSASSAILGRSNTSPEKRVRFDVEDVDDEGEEVEAGDITEDDLDDGEFSREELLAIYPVVFDSAHLATSRKVLTKQLKTVREILREQEDEEAYLEARDQRQNVREEQLLWKALLDDHKGLPFAYSQTLAKEESDDGEPLRRGSQAAAEWLTEPTGDWRDYTEYVGAWERRLSRPAQP